MPIPGAAVRRLTRQEAEDLVWGAALFATGGGGPPEAGLRMVEALYSAGLSISLARPEELRGYAASPYFVGSVKRGRGPGPEELRALLGRAVEQLGSLLGSPIGATVATELGGGNTAVALYCASLLGLPALDGDLMGRAGPELHQSTAHVVGVPVTPSLICTLGGDMVIVRSISGVDFYEALARQVSVLAGGEALVLDTPLSAEEAGRALVPGTLSHCIRAGALLRQRKGAEELAEELGGLYLFEGRVSSLKLRTEGGFLVGEARFEGEGRSRGRRLRSYIKNEHIMVWLDDRPLVMPPDLFTLLGPEGLPLTNAELEPGMKVQGLGFPAPRIWRTPRGLELFGPRHFGFELDYRPIEELFEGSGQA